MNIPNLMTLIRIILVPVLIICLIQGFYLKALIVFMVAGLTDALDGFLARVLHQKSILGAYMDPLADKALIVSSFVTLSVMAVIPSWLTVIVISRDIVLLTGICILTLISVPVEIKPAVVSKITTAFQLLTVFISLLTLASLVCLGKKIEYIIFWTTAVMTVISGLTYVSRGIRVFNRSSVKK
jgi:cardiolipin synthase